jgi:hypothetical protein
MTWDDVRRILGGLPETGEYDYFGTPASFDERMLMQAWRQAALKRMIKALEARDP